MLHVLKNFFICKDNYVLVHSDPNDTEKDIKEVKKKSKKRSRETEENNLLVDNGNICLFIFNLMTIQFKHDLTRSGNLTLSVFALSYTVHLHKQKYDHALLLEDSIS